MKEAIEQLLKDLKKYKAEANEQYQDNLIQSGFGQGVATGKKCMIDIVSGRLKQVLAEDGKADQGRAS